MRSLQKIKPFRWGIELVLITIFQIISFSDVLLDAGEYSGRFLVIFGAFFACEWAYTLLMRIILKQTSFELEFIAFFLSSIGLSLVATLDTDFFESGDLDTPYYSGRQILFIVAGLIGFIILRWVIANADRVSKLRLPVAVLSGLMLAANIVLGSEINGAKNWISIGGFSIQPSELVKVLFIFVGAATLDKLQTTRSIVKYMIFSLGCIGALFIMKDLGSAVVFFVVFLIITFMRSGDFRAIVLICIVAAVGAILVVYFLKLGHVTQRLENYRHIWDDPYGLGMQQTRVLMYSASGGLFGLGLGKGMLRGTFAATTDLIFGMICEEYGLIIGFAVIVCFAAIVVYTVAGARGSRSTFYAIAACASAGLLLVQVSLNVFGVTDLIPLTGVTLPFISRGGSSLISCWMLMAYIKSIDPRAYPKTLRETQALG